MLIPPARHFQVGKGEPGKQRIERFNNTLGQRRSRLVRKSFSRFKKLENQVGAPWDCIDQYKRVLTRLALPSF